MRLCLFLIFHVFALFLQGQSFHYINYNIKDGLAGSIVYSMCQDKDGFMWFGTDNGLSRYDGTHFKNFTIKDGLPDNEVLKVFADSKGRVWIGTFSKEVCYYQNGKIYNKSNSELLRKIKFESNIEVITESNNGTLCIASRFTINIVTQADSTIRYLQNEICNDKGINVLVYNLFGKISIGTTSRDIYIYEETNYKWKKLKTVQKGFFSPDYAIVLFDTLRNNNIFIKGRGNELSSERYGLTLRYINTLDGTWLVDSNSLNLSTHYLKGQVISRTVEDKEKNLWFSSLGNGVFKLPSVYIKTMLSGDSTQNSCPVFSIVKFKNKVLCGSDKNRGYFFDSSLSTDKLSISQELRRVIKFGGPGRLYSLTNISHTVALLGFDGCIAKLDNKKLSFKYLGGPVKSVEKINDTSFIAGTSFFAFKIRLRDLEIIDTIWRERCTKVFYSNGNYYIGTLAGLYEVKEDKSFYYLGNLHPVLTRRIMDIKKSPDGVLWVSSSDKGVIGIKDRKIMRVIDDSTGLSSNNGKTLFVKDDFLWVGTNNGICKINISPGNKNEIVKYSVSDGLPSNNINAVYVDDSAVWVGTPEGLTFFKEKDISASSICNLKMIQVSMGGVPVPVDSFYHLSYKKNDIRFEFAGISFRSGSEITYYYKFNGIDNDWKITKDNFLDYKTLPPGDYRLQLYAVNKYGVKSNDITISISVSTPFWKTAWFFILMALAAGGCIIYFLNRRNRLTKEKLEEKNRLQKQFAELEQQALQSQMNPHFIFNCLNSIQQYIFTGDNERANQYLTEFAHLIRQTLTISSQKTISLSEETGYLTRYLQMEQMRFGNSFTFDIRIDGITNPDLLEIPSLLIQPFVENSLRHGIRHLNERTGMIEISFGLNENILTCKIKDNGVGREKASGYKSKQHIEYQSKGISLTSKRIDLLNMVSEKKISLNITDLKDEKDNPAGTQVELIIPL